MDGNSDDVGAPVADDLEQPTIVAAVALELVGIRDVDALQDQRLPLSVDEGVALDGDPAQALR
jgi:hypothetical protein